MAKKILITKFNYSMSTGEFKKILPLVAPEFSKIPGCSWKIWLLNEDNKEAGGIYLFESATDLDQFLESNLFMSVRKNKAFTNLQTNISGIAEEASVITGGPLMNTA
jgi:hypothetical protein